jgi:hypothetical protein
MTFISSCRELLHPPCRGDKATRAVKPNIKFLLTEYRFGRDTDARGAPFRLSVTHFTESTDVNIQRYTKDGRRLAAPESPGRRSNLEQSRKETWLFSFLLIVSGERESTSGKLEKDKVDAGGDKRLFSLAQKAKKAARYQHRVSL